MMKNVYSAAGFTPRKASVAIMVGLAWAAMHSSLQTWATEVLPSARATVVSLVAGSLFVGSAVAALAVLINLFNPELVILGGQVADAGEDLLIPLREEVWERTRGLLGRDVEIVEQQVADKSGIVGAAGLVMAPRT